MTKHAVDEWLPDTFLTRIIVGSEWCPLRVKSPIPSKQKAGCAPQLVRTNWEYINISCQYGESNHDYSVVQPTFWSLYWLSYAGSNCVCGKNEDELRTTTNIEQGSWSRKQTEKHSASVQYRLSMERNAKCHSTKHASQVSNRSAVTSKGTAKKPADEPSR